MPLVKIKINPNGIIIDAPGFSGCDLHMEKFKKLGKIKKEIRKDIKHTHIKRKIEKHEIIEQ